jgi:hypothetical protein
VSFDPDAFVGSAPSGFDPDAFASGSSGAGSFKSRGVRQTDGTWIVPTPQGPVHLDEYGEPLEAIHTPGGSQDVEAASKEGVLNRVLATAQGGAQGLVPQMAGLRALAEGGNYRQARDEARATVAAAEEEAGPLYGLAGSMLSSGLVAPETVAARLALSAGLGGVGSAAASDGDLGEVAKGLGIGLVAGGVGEAVGAGIQRLGKKLWSTAADAIANQAEKDAATIEKKIASLEGELGANVQKGSRYSENLQRAISGIPEEGGLGAVSGELRAEAIAALRESGSQATMERVARSSIKKLPGQAKTIDEIETELIAKQASAEEDAAKLTADYFATSVWKGDIKDRIKNVLAPRFGLAAIGAVTGELMGSAAGFERHEGGFLGFGMGGLNSPGIRQMTKNLARSNRVRVAVAEKLIPVLITASHIAPGLSAIATATVLSRVTASEADLGNPDLAAEQLAARGGLGSILGDHPPDVGYLTGTTTPQTPLDHAIHQTVGVTQLAGTLDAHHTEIDKAVSGFLGGKAAEKPKSKPLPDGVHELAVNPQALVDRVANNIGGLHTVAPGIAGGLTSVAQRAVQHLSTLASAPVARGPLAPAWKPTRSETRIVEQACAVIDDPLILLEHARAGTLTRAHIAAAQAVYPTLTRAIGDRALDAAIGSNKRPSHQQRQMLTLLTGIDVDGSRAATASNQRTIQAPSTKPSNAGAPGTAGAEKLTLGQRMATPHQRERDET